MYRQRQGLLVFLLNFVSFVAFAVVAFRFNEHWLFHGLDGSYIMQLVRQHYAWDDPSLGYANNFLQGLGDISFALNPGLIPGYHFGAIFNGGEINPVASYAIFASELFVSTYLLALFLRLGPVTASVAAWGLPLAALPILGFGRVTLIYPVMALVPHVASAMAISVLLVILFWFVGRAHALVTLVCILAMAFLVFYLVFAYPLAIVLMVPSLVIFGLCALYVTRTSTELYTKLGTVGVLVLLLVVSDCATFLLGMYKYTTAHFFGYELLNDRMTWLMASLAFQPTGVLMFVLGLAGAIWMALSNDEGRREFAAGTVICAGLVIVVGVANKVLDMWQGPSPLYFEFFLWPWYTVFAAALLVAVARKLRERLRGNVERAPQAHSMLGRRRWTWGLAPAVLPWVFVLVMAARAAPQQRTNPYPPPKTAIVELLEKEVGLVPGQPFRGRVATYTGQNISGPANWLQLHHGDYWLIQKFGNDHRLVGLWYHGIPTLAEYNQLMSPVYYRFTREFLAKPDDPQMRVIMVLRKLDPMFLRMLGIRFVIADSVMPQAGELRMIMADDEPRTALYLYELANMNVGQYSPTAEVSVEDADGAIRVMSRPDFEPGNVFVTNHPVNTALVPAEASTLYAEKGGVRLQASSKGTSVVLLPLEFSHCLDLLEEDGSGSRARLFRANLLLTGVVFEGKINASIRYHTSPFRNSHCRVKDTDDANSLRIGIASRAPS